MCISGADGYAMYTQIPPPGKFGKKALVILKANRGIEINNENAQSELVFTELLRNALENMSIISQEGYLPIISNRANQQGWSEDVAKDLMEKVHGFLSSVYVTIGQVRGKTLLPLPPENVTTSTSTSSKDKAHILEGAIITWIKQIKNVLKQEPESLLKQDRNPNPIEEIEFWRGKADNLNSIHSQLQSPEVKKVFKFLEQNKSTYTDQFTKVQASVKKARAEANDNYTYLQTLYQLFTELIDDSKDLPEITDLFQPIMHVILLIWNHSQYYNTTARIVVLIREICNAIIDQAYNYINGEQIFNCIANEEAQQAHDKLSITLDVCSKFKEAYFMYKSKANNMWVISPSGVFVRLDSFAERCQDIMHFTSTIVQFSKLAKIEIGGTKGSILTKAVANISEEFQQIVEHFQAVEYDIMDISAKSFDDDFYNFRSKIKELERRLGAILTQSFDDTDTIIGKFKLLESFEGLLNRPIIQDELEKKHISLIEMFKEDLKAVQKLFIEGKALIEKNDANMPIASNLPPVAGTLFWTKGLRERITDPMDRLSHINQASSLQEREEYKDAHKLYISLLKSMKEYEEIKTKEWAAGVQETSDEKLNMPLFKRMEEDNTIKVNFAPELVALLRETKYLLLLDLEVPEAGNTLFTKVETYRRQTCLLDQISDMYNNILKTLLPVEEPLLVEKITRMNRILDPGFKDHKWTSPSVDNFIQSAMHVVREVDNLVKTMKENVDKMIKHMESWAKKPLIERKNKPMSPEDFIPQHNASVAARKQDIMLQGREIHKFLSDTATHLKAVKAGEEWKNYEAYVNGIIVDGLSNAIMFSMQALMEIITPNPVLKRSVEYIPFFDIQVLLTDKEVVFEPPIDEVKELNSVRDVINAFINDFMEISSVINRIDTKTGDYLKETRDNFEICAMISVLTNSLDFMEVYIYIYIYIYRTPPRNGLSSSRITSSSGRRIWTKTSMNS